MSLYYLKKLTTKIKKIITNKDEILDAVTFLRNKEVEKLNLETIEKIKKRLSDKNEKLNVLFLVSESSKWNSQSLYNELKNEPRINVTIAVDKTPYDGKDANTIANYFNKSFEFFKKIDKNAIKLYDEENNVFKPIEELNADIIFYQQPWGMLSYPERMAGKALSAYMHYGFMLTNNSDMHYNLPSFHYYLWKYFTQTEGHKSLHLEWDNYAHNKIMVSGYTKLDVYFENETVQDENIWKINKKESPSIKRVIYAPHYSFSKSAIKLGTFTWNHKYLLNLAKSNKNIQWIYKPHPKLKSEAVKFKIMTEVEYDNYVKEWDSLPNAKVYESGNYFDIFKSSDCLITDCGSFLGEYLPTKKPIIHLIRQDSIGYNKVGQTIVKDYYKAHNLKELDDLIKRVILDEDDYLYTERMKALKFLMPNDEKVSICIKNYLKEVVGLK